MLTRSYLCSLKFVSLLLSSWGERKKGEFEMNIYVLIKRTLDTEEKIVLNNGAVELDGATCIINPYDEYALEEAIKVKESQGGEITVVTVGGEDSEKELRTALAMGCDKAVLINIEDDVENGDQYTTATILGEYLKGKEADIIFAGNVAIDGGSGQVGPRVADILGISCVTAITKLEIDGDKAVIERDIEGYTEIVELSLPFLATAQQGLNDPRYPSLPGIMKAKKKPLEELELDDLDLEAEDVAGKTKTLERYLPPQKEAGKMLTGATKESVKELISLLRTEAKVI